MQCQKCEKPATFHITDLTGDEVLALHLCHECAKDYLQPTNEESAPTLASVFTEQLELGQTAEEMAELDQKECPICGITFFEFRKSGRLGCPHDYTFFGSELEPLLVNVHGVSKHVGKSPRRGAYDAESQTELIRLRREMRVAVEKENYEQASEIRDRIRQIEQEGQA